MEKYKRFADKGTGVNQAWARGRPHRVGKGPSVVFVFSVFPKGPDFSTFVWLEVVPSEVMAVSSQGKQTQKEPSFFCLVWFGLVWFRAQVFITLAVLTRFSRSWSVISEPLELADKLAATGAPSLVICPFPAPQVDKL